MIYALYAALGFIGLIILYIGWLVLKSYMIAKKAEKYLPPLGEFMEVDGEKIHYLDRGKGPVLVLIHGLSGQMRNFTHSMLERLENDFRVIIIDRPGCGYSTRKSDDAARISQQANTIAAFIRKLDLKEKPLIAGHSLGGGITLSLAINHKDIVGGVALISALTHPVSRDREIPTVFKGLAIRSPLMRRIVAWTLATPASIKNGPAALANVFSPEPFPADVSTKGGGMLGLRPWAYYAASTDFNKSIIDIEHMPQHYSDLEMPVGLIYGTQDNILDYEAHALPLKEKIRDLDLELLENCGHMIPITQPDAVTAFIKRQAVRMHTPAMQAVN
ncbi:MAG: alpha/beta fold hydrolase [Methyloligellaceae bacterium]